MEYCISDYINDHDESVRSRLIAAILFFLYAANCGVNYYRDSFVDQASLQSAEFTDDQLTELCEYIASHS